MAEIHKDWKIKGRGSVSNPTGRFEKESISPFDDGWGSLEQLAPEAIETVLRPETARSIISKNDSPDIPFSQGLNPYQGCEHGCVYCYARPSHAYFNLSPGLDFETQIFYKANAAELLEKAFSNKRYVVKPIVIGSNTDPYQPAEKSLKLSREILEVCLRYKHPVGIISKSALITRDIDILSDMAEQNLARVFISITSLDNRLSRLMEPRAAAPERRFQTVQSLHEAGIPVGVMAAPMILGLNDRELEQILERSAQAGAFGAGYTLLRLPHEVKEVFISWVRQHYPDGAGRIIARIRDSRSGQLNVSDFSSRMTGTGLYAELLKKRFRLACRRFGLDKERKALNLEAFTRPAKAGDQLSLF